MIRLKYGDGSFLNVAPGQTETSRPSTGSANIDAAFDGIESFMMALVRQEVRGLTQAKLQAALTEAEDAIMNNMDVS
jgi:hypothetical protein